MCIAPKTIKVLRGPEWCDETVSCGHCWQCRSNNVSDYVGRSLCEASTSDATLAITLTYAPRDDLAEKVITPRHLQDFIRALRKRGHLVRYLACGEHGEKKGRAHFHAVLFFRYKPGVSKQDTPSRMWPQKTMFHLDEWPHGHVFVDHDADDKALRYVCKYILKYEGTESWFTCSKKPPLGAAFFKQKAQLLAKNNVLPVSFSYQPPNGTPGRSYHLTGASRRDYLLEICRNLDLDRKDMLERASKWVETALQKAWKADHIKNATPLTFEELAESIRFEQEWGAKVFTAEWEKRFLKKNRKRKY